MGLFDSIYRISARMTETGLLMMDSTLRGMQSTIDRLGGQASNRPLTDPPVNGPATLDDATSTLSNQLFRIAWTTPMSSPGMLNAWREVVHATRRSFSGLELNSPADWMSLPLQLPLSFGTLLTQQAVRAFHISSILGPRRVPEFASYMAESFNDIEVFLSLQYKEELARLREEVQRAPEDGKAHLRLGQMLIKLGLYQDAAQELALAARDGAVRAEALSERTVAHFRSGEFREAVKDGVTSLSLRPDHSRTRFWLWLAAQQMGGYPAEAPSSARMEVNTGRHESKLRFEEVARDTGLDKTAAGRGTAVFDMDGDGYLDVVVSSAHAGCSLYRNNGDGTFSDVTVGSGLDGCVNSFVIAVGDYNNDGLDDLFVTRLGFYPGDSVLFRNNGDGTFTDVTREAGVNCWGPGFAAQWVDYDCDGNLDLFVANNLGGLFDRKTPNRLFRNNGNGTFSEVSQEAGLHSLVPSICGAWGDYDNDGYPDLFVSNGIGRSQLFHNNGDGTFTDVSREAGVEKACFGSVSFWCDYDNDGWLDLVQYVWSPEDDVLYTLMNGIGPRDGNPMRIYHNNRNGTFTLRNRELGLTGCWGTMSGAAGDVNNDGYIDFFLGNGDPHMNRTEPPTLFEYDPRNGKYRDVTFTTGLPHFGKTHGANMADLTGDGRLSLLLASGGAYPGDLVTMSVFRPTTLPGNYLNVRLVGTRSNRNAIGARLRMDAGGRSVHLLVNGGTGFGCQPHEQHFGLGTCTRIDGLEILWPNGLKQHLANPPVNSTIRITEGKAGYQEVYESRYQKRLGAL
jgi:hypothetical protein